jgi:hypothetical protein
MSQIDPNTINLTTPLELYRAFKESPTTYWAVRIVANPYLGTNDRDPLSLVPNICGPITDPENVTFVERFEPLEGTTIDEATMDLLRTYNLIMVVDSYFQVPAFHKASLDFNQRTRLCEILREGLNRNQALKDMFPVRKTPTLFIRESENPLVFGRYRREITYPVIYELLRTGVAEEFGEAFTPNPYLYPERNRFRTCGGTVKRGRVTEIRKYTFNFEERDFNPTPSMASSFEATQGISKILVGEKVEASTFQSIFTDRGVTGPYRLKVFFSPENKNIVRSTIESVVNAYIEINGEREMVYRIANSVNIFTEMTILINILQAQSSQVVSGKNGLSDKVEEWGLGAPDTIFRFQTSSDFLILSERAVLNELEGEDLLEKLLDSIQLTEEEIQTVNDNYELFIQDEANALIPDTEELREKWLQDALTRKRQGGYFKRVDQRPLSSENEFDEVVDQPSLSGALSTRQAPEFERYNATGDIPLGVFGSWERALDEERQIIFKEFETRDLPEGGTIIEYNDYLIGTYRKYHPNGFLERISNYKNETKAMKSLLDGPYLEYFNDGRRRIIGGFQDDLLHGSYKEFYQNTFPKCQGTLRRGKLNGLYVQWDEEGNRLFKTYFIGGTLNNSYALDYQVFANTPCLSRNSIFIALTAAFDKTELDDNDPPNEVPRAYTFTELYTLLTTPDPGRGEVIEGLVYPLLDVDGQPEYQLLAILNQVADRISGGVRHGKYTRKENISLI